MASPEALDFLLARRSRPAKLLSPPAPPRAEVPAAPDRGRARARPRQAEPWRFVVLEGAGLARFARGDPGAGRR